MQVPFGKYLLPSPLLRELMFLDCLLTSPYRSQAEIARLIGLTPAMVNAYVSRLESEGCITKQVTGRGAVYHVTEEGTRRRDFHLISYLAELSEFAANARSHFQQFFCALAAEGVRTVVFFGAGETATVVGQALGQLEAVRLVGIVDDDPAKQGTMLLGHVIQGPESILPLRPDVVLITTWRFTDEIQQRLRWLLGTGIQVRTLVPSPTVLRGDST